MTSTAAPDAPLTPSALKRLFLGRRPARGVSEFSLPGGRTLFAAGDPAEALYLVRAGRLVVLRESAAGSQVLGVVRPGEPVGEMALIAGTPHTATVMALRDSEVLALPRDAFLREARLRPDIMAELARLVVTRAREAPVANRGAPTVFGFVGVSHGAPVRPLAERVAARMRALGRRVEVIGAEGLGQSSGWFSELELQHDLLLLTAERDEAEWRALVGRQVDQLLLVARSDAPQPQAPSAFAATAIKQNRLVDVVLVHPPGAGASPGAQAWVDAAGATRLFHLHEGSYEDLARLARVLTGSSVGLVLSGGGARAYAHIGAVRALREAGQPIDLVGGASMGAIIGAGVAMGWDVAELDARMREAFVKSNPLGDMTFPMVALSRGNRVRRRLRDHFGEVEFADLRLPFYCVSSNLTTGEYALHRSGRLRRALRASAALPGVAPPVVDQDAVLVDGGVLNNLPTDVMRGLHHGPVVGVDVALAEELRSEDVEKPPSLWRFVASGQWRRRGPPIMALLMRSATVTTHREYVAARAASDALVVPDIPDVGLQDWKLYDAAVEAGYRATLGMLEGLDRPLTELRPREGSPGEPPPDALDLGAPDEAPVE